MKYVFIVNPASGQGKNKKELVPRIEQLMKAHPDKDIKIYYTRGEKDATVLADQILKETEDKVTVFACGGDGTIHEVVNGVYGHNNAVLAVVPVGSGNDFARALGGGLNEGVKYKNLSAHIDAPVKKIDLIKMTWEENGKDVSHICDNGINIGFDGNACIRAHELKTLPGVSGTGSYILAVTQCLALKKGEDLKITADGELVHDGPLLLTTVGNGGFCGGGFESCPRADLSDGLLELLVVNNISRAKFVSMVPKYKGGKIFDIDDQGGKLYKYRQAKKIEIEPNNGKMKYVGDGEMFETGKLTIEVIKDAINVVYL
ncbi:MAG: hypothetical protein KBS56_03920 [Clostridiales bacterium]|nr:hypothetical protein [Candidatus Crickella equi]